MKMCENIVIIALCFELEFDLFLECGEGIRNVDMWSIKLILFVLFSQDNLFLRINDFYLENKVNSQIMYAVLYLGDNYKSLRICRM